MECRNHEWGRVKKCQELVTEMDMLGNEFAELLMLAEALQRVEYIEHGKISVVSGLRWFRSAVGLRTQLCLYQCSFPNFIEDVAVSRSL